MTAADTIREAIQEHVWADVGCDPAQILAALDRLVAVRDAAEWLVANRGHRGEAQAWKLLADALAKEDTDE